MNARLVSTIASEPLELDLERGPHESISKPSPAQAAKETFLATSTALSHTPQPLRSSPTEVQLSRNILECARVQYPASPFPSVCALQ
jgi:hypothetical protein